MWASCEDVLMLENTAGEDGVISVVGCSEVREELLNLTLVIRFFDSIVTLFIEVDSFEDEIW